MRPYRNTLNLLDRPPSMDFMRKVEHFEVPTTCSVFHFRLNIQFFLFFF